MRYPCLSIAGFDGSGGAGLQADLKTFSALGCYGMSVLTALPVQNTQGVRACYEIPLLAIEEQLETIFTDITPKAIKIGMLFKADIIALVAASLRQYAATIPIVLDPVMVAKSGAPLLLPEAMIMLKRELLPLATIVTPNLPEAQALTGKASSASLEELATALLDEGAKAVLVKGGHSLGLESNDLLVASGAQTLLSSERIQSENTHGTGCTLSAAIAAFLAQGDGLAEACKKAKQYLFSALKASQFQKIGKGKGPVHHFYQYY